MFRYSTLTKGVMTFVLSVAVSPAFSFSLYDAVVSAAENDPAFQSNRFDYRANELEEDIARADLLPQVFYNRSEGKADYKRSAVNSLTPPSSVEVDTLNESLTIAQEIINVEAWNRYGVAKSRSELAVQRFRSDTLDLYLRVSGLYFEVIAAFQNYELSQSEVKYYEELVGLTRQGLASGESSNLDLVSAQAEYDLSSAGLVETSQALTTAVSRLEAVVGKKVTDIQAFGSGFQNRVSQIGSLDSYEKEARIKNPVVRSAALQVEIAEKTFDQRRAGHYPSLSVVHSISKTESDTVNTVGTENDVTSTSLRLSVPIFSGLKVNKLVEQASARKAQAEAEFLLTQRDILISLQEAHFQSLNASRKIGAFEKAVESAKLALQAAEAGLKAGLNVYSDVLLSKRDLNSATRDLQRVRLESARSFLSLIAFSGQLNLINVKQLSALQDSPKTIPIGNFDRANILAGEKPEGVLQIQLDKDESLKLYSVPSMKSDVPLNENNKDDDEQSGSQLHENKEQTGLESSASSLALKTDIEEPTMVVSDNSPLRRRGPR